MNLHFGSSYLKSRALAPPFAPSESRGLSRAASRGLSRAASRGRQRHYREASPVLATMHGSGEALPRLGSARTVGFAGHLSGKHHVHGQRCV
jgi:hypothetical protein